MPNWKSRALADAQSVLANPAAHRPSLIHMARLVALSAYNTTPRQSRPRKGGAA